MMGTMTKIPVPAAKAALTQKKDPSFKAILAIGVAAKLTRPEAKAMPPYNTPAMKTKKRGKKVVRFLFFFSLFFLFTIVFKPKVGCDITGPDSINKSEIGGENDEASNLKRHDVNHSNS
jgi:hypothetical protein